MLKKVLLVVAAIVAVLVAVIATRPAGYQVERSATVAAPPEVVYAQVADFGRWAQWSPWAKLDPGMKTTLTGAPGSVGHGYAWVGNDKVGEGRMTITEAAPGSRVAIKLEFLKPMEAVSPTTFTFAPDGAGTRVSWKMVGTNNFMGKAMSLFMDFEKMIGGDFEKGLSQLRAAAEAEARAAPPSGGEAAAAAAPSR
ncbi:MAG: SRPBCC family protein [Deltaproteobacteria bacterium]|nr:SRPBCC family protein [Deltaproteobacteria bacterium]